MNSLGNSSKWPSYDSLPSTPSFLLSETEQTEDEAETFSEGEGDSGIRKSPSADEGISLSGSYLGLSSHTNRLRSRAQRDRAERCSDKTNPPDSAPSPEDPTLSSSVTPGDIAFAQKCADLHRFIHPLLELLHGLQTGRFDRGLTSFQQSVAMDRLQRILGILQKPEMGEKYLQNLLQIEMLLKMWFPREASTSTDTPNKTTTPRLAPHWRQNQLHMPVKKRKLSWPDSAQAGTVPTKHGKHGSCHAATSLDAVFTCRRGTPTEQKTPEEEPDEPAGYTSVHEFTRRTGTLSRPSYLCSRRANESRKQPEISPPSSSCGSPATQDSLVSSSNIITTSDSP
ncbi:circadian associated repressor of transcription a [Archocentrus centrarchus]|uniref:circadian associated repressor of transcription a n=1 Tax=Archocentrus centrarchus TaxID=63155 RepID=UPI0011EA113B|nr:circadian-associated transcriptional repressor-like [Archocentrus centrarchus]